MDNYEAPAICPHARPIYQQLSANKVLRCRRENVSPFFDLHDDRVNISGFWTVGDEIQIYTVNHQYKQELTCEIGRKKKTKWIIKTDVKGSQWCHRGWCDLAVTWRLIGWCLCSSTNSSISWSSRDRKLSERTDSGTSAFFLMLSNISFRVRGSICPSLTCCHTSWPIKAQQDVTGTLRCVYSKKDMLSAFKWH